MLVFYYLSMSDLLSLIISNIDKHDFSSIWEWICCCNDVMNDVDCVIKRDVYPHKMHSCSKNIRGMSVFVLKIFVVYQKLLAIFLAHIQASHAGEIQHDGKKIRIYTQ